MDNNGYDNGGENPETNPENIEMKDLNPDEDEYFDPFDDITSPTKDTSFIEKSNRLLDNDGVLEMNELNNLFVNVDPPSTSVFDPNAVPNPKRDVGVIKRSIITDKKQFIFKVFGIKVNKGSGISSKLLYDELKITTGEKSGKINGAMYKGKKILILMKNGEMTYSKGKVNLKLIMEFKNTLNGALEENKKTPASIVEDRIPHEISEEAVNNIVENSGDDMDLESFVILQNVEKKPLTSQEVRELMGVLSVNWGELKKKGGKKLVEKNIKAVEIEKENLKRKAFEAKVRKNDVEEAVYNEMVRATELKIDSGRLMINEKPKGNLAVEILNKEADVNEMSKFEKFKKWSKENLLGLSAIAITIAGIIVTIVSATRTVVRAGASTLSKFANAVAKIASKFTPVIAAIGSVLASILMAGTKGLLWLAKNLWVLAIALTYFLYNEYKKK